MTIHFICMGNMYRSRLAEAYMKSLHLKGYEVMSSGVLADTVTVRQGPIMPYAKAIIKHYRLGEYAKPKHDQLTQERLNDSDIVVCMNRRVYDLAKQHYELPLRTIIWDIADVNEVYRHHPKWLLDQHRVGELAERTFVQIMRRVDELALLLKRTKRNHTTVDVLHPDGRLTGYTATLSEVNNKGLWHDGVHAALYTRDGQVLIEQRSAEIVTNPNLWEMSLGGCVDAGETPDAAMLREIREEVGIRLKPEQLQKVSVRRENHYMPAFGFHSRVMLHCYIAPLPRSLHIRLQASEVQGWKLVSSTELRRLLKHPQAATELIHAPDLHLELLGAIEDELAVRAA